MDKTLRDYIERAMKQLNRDKENAEQDPNHYPVSPENDDTDTPKNPYGNH